MFLLLFCVCFEQLKKTKHFTSQTWEHTSFINCINYKIKFDLTIKNTKKFEFIQANLQLLQNLIRNYYSADPHKRFETMAISCCQPECESNRRSLPLSYCHSSSASAWFLASVEVVVVRCHCDTFAATPRHYFRCCCCIVLLSRNYSEPISWCWMLLYHFHWDWVHFYRHYLVRYIVDWLIVVEPAAALFPVIFWDCLRSMTSLAMIAPHSPQFV